MNPQNLYWLLEMVTESTTVKIENVPETPLLYSSTDELQRYQLNRHLSKMTELTLDFYLKIDDFLLRFSI